ncbi:thiopurine S-methyltransferase [Acetobacter cibinongensis]|uniref:Thiopurine S-methyltransferase n=1 Tax=Acetobacter cibinongensis TaxID=146475 RepID=A0A1Z5YVY7_9PROT|nr:thiopurine S-methyltransferase [Acetobacter cibinongensis]OUJ03099.1 thiopurine S-methyltransferase [Acetobacter cibinongensis]
MDASFWLDKWQRNETGFHAAEPHAFLLRHFPAVNLAAGAHVFVPLCGKTVDIHWLLAQGFRVTGSELSQTAVESLFQDLGYKPEITLTDYGPCYSAGPLRVFVGDIFRLDATAVGAVDAVYDRAALIALPHHMRQLYAAHVVQITHAARQLLVCLDYDQTRRAGPPFSVDERELRALYAGHYTLTEQEAEAVPGGLKGICPAQEVVWLLSPKRL